jgi:hypothetical protein
MSESAQVHQGERVTIINTSTNSVDFADTAGVQEMPTGGISLGQWDAIELRYASDRWVRVGGSDN